MWGSHLTLPPAMLGFSAQLQVKAGQNIVEEKREKKKERKKKGEREREERKEERVNFSLSAICRGWKEGHMPGTWSRVGSPTPNSFLKGWGTETALW